MRFFLLLISLMSSLTIAASDVGSINTLIVTGGHGFNTNAFFEVFKSNPGIRFTNAVQSKTSAVAYDRSDLFDYDVVVLYDMIQNITPEQQRRFKELFERGIGLVVMHHALVSFQKWPEYERIIGGIYPEPQDKPGAVSDKLGYEHDVDIPVIVVAKDHPVTARLNSFSIHDEIYWGFRTGSDVTPLLTTTHPRSGKPLAWARQEGKSRVVYLQLGHGPSAFQDPNFRRLVAQSIKWTARD